VTVGPQHGVRVARNVAVGFGVYVGPGAVGTAVGSIHNGTHCIEPMHTLPTIFIHPLPHTPFIGSPHVESMKIFP